MILKEFLFLIEISLKASIIIMIILVLKWTIGRKMSARWHYLLWFVVVLALLIPMIPIREIQTVKQVIPFPDLDIQNYSYTILDEEISQDQVMTNQKTLSRPVEWFGLGIKFLCLIWAVGFALNFFYLCAINISFAIRLKRKHTLIPVNRLVQMKNCASLIGLNRLPQVFETSQVLLPAVYGIYNPILLIPIGFDEHVEPEEMHLILMHELLHIKRRDVLVNVFVTVLKVIHWFNPVILYAFNHMCSDREMACDEMVLKLSRNSENYKYGSLIIKLLQLRTTTSSVSLVGMSVNKKFMKRRIYMITQVGKKRNHLRYLAALTFIIVSIFTVAFTLNDRMGSESERVIVDDIDLPFVDDPEVLGEWESVDFVKEIEDFDVDNKFFRDELYMTKLVFLENGELKVNDDTDRPWFKWTYGVVTHDGDHTASKYTIEDINGDTYMFFEWKSGDYTIRGKQPQYYVLKKVE